MTKTRILFIANPISGTHDKRPVIKSLPHFLPEERFEWDVAWTDHKGHAAEIAQQAAKEGIDICAAIGGDGTVNEVARSLCHTQTALAIIPMGSGNGLARHIQIPMSPDGALEVLARCDIKPLDYGLINDIPFFCTCGMGFDAFVSQKFAEAGKRGPITYVENVLREGLKYKPETYEIQDETGITRAKAFLISCANASQYGNNAYIAPQASMSDGLLDVIIMEPFDMIDAPQISIDMFNKTLDKNSKIKTFKCRQLRIHRKNPGVIHYDGDPIMADADVEIVLKPKGIRVVVNPDADKRLRRPNMLQNAASELFNEINIVREDITKQRRHVLALSKILQRKLLG